MGPWDLIFRCCDARDLTILAATTRELRNLIKSYNARSYASSYQSILSKFFSTTEVAVFRTIQAATGTLISGSSALQFFERVDWHGSDLDLYVEARFTRRVSNFLVRTCGYAYTKDVHQEQGLAAQQAMHENSYLRHGVVDVLNFKKKWIKETMNDLADAVMEVDGSRSKHGEEEEKESKEDTRIVQVIVASSSPIDVILDFHSSEILYFSDIFAHYVAAVVMNIISAYNAISFFPLETLYHRRSIITSDRPQHDGTIAALNKYTKRGWQMFRMDPYYFTEERMDTMNFYLNQTRFVGDSKCFTVSLDGSSMEESLKRDPIVINSWRTNYVTRPEKIMTKHIFEDESLRNTYMFGGQELLRGYRSALRRTDQQNKPNEEE
jgi:hypothetical protein